MSYYQRALNDHGVICDRCGAKRFKVSTGHYDTGWVWAPIYSVGVYPCDECGQNANEHVPADLIFPDVLEALEAMGDAT